jgi:hypothetical protein
MKYKTFLLPRAKADMNAPQEVKLSETRAERDLQDSLAEVFSIIITLDELEKAYLKDAISESDYTGICDRLLKQYKSILTDEAVAREFVDLETFKNEWDVCVTITRFDVPVAKSCRWKFREPPSGYGLECPAP